MEFDKYVLRKKWWQSASYSIIDANGHQICTSIQKGFFSSCIELIDNNQKGFLSIHKKSAGSIDHYFETSNGIVANFIGSWTGGKFNIYPVEGSPILMQVNMWNNKIDFYIGDKSVGLASANSYYSEIGCVINREVEPSIMIASLITIGHLKANGYC